MVMFTEGKVRLSLPALEGDQKAQVFYNARMNLNRDLAVLFASSYFPAGKHLRICDPMTGSGVRAARYIVESENVASVVAADKDPEALEYARMTMQLNALQEKVTVIESDANMLLQKHVQERFDLVDLDPFGSPAPFLESAARATADGGVIATTATDMGPLTGARPAACVRKYGTRPIRVEFEKEMGVRTLAACLASIAVRLELGIKVAFSHASDHYARIYAEILKGRPFANISTKTLGFIEYCSTCLRRDSRLSLNMIRTACEDCGSKTSIGGPIWLGPLWDTDTLAKMIQRTPMLESSRLSEVQRILACIDDERVAPPFHHRIDSISRILGKKPPGLKQVLDTFREAGYHTTRTHFHPNGFRTEATNSEIISIMRSLSREA